MINWTAADIPDQQGRTIVVAGANSGLGAEAATLLVAAGAKVIMACRDLDRGQAVAERIGGDVTVRRLDLADLSSVRAFAGDLPGEVHVLINNAGVMGVRRGTTPDGFELHFGVNHLGPFLLTGLLLDRVTARVVTVTSGLHRLGRLPADPSATAVPYLRWAAYARSKLANLLFSHELHRRLMATDRRLVSLAAHPGVAATEGQRRDTSVQGKILAGGAAQPPAVGVLPILYAATAAGVRGGTCVGPDGRLQRSGHPTVVGTSLRSRDPEAARRLWLESERLTGFSYPV